MFFRHICRAHGEMHHPGTVPLPGVVRSVLLGSPSSHMTATAATTVRPVHPWCVRPLTFVLVGLAVHWGSPLLGSRSLQSNSIGAPGAKELAAALGTNTTLTRLE